MKTTIRAAKKKFINFIFAFECDIDTDIRYKFISGKDNKPDMIYSLDENYNNKDNCGFVANNEFLYSDTPIFAL